MFLGKHVLELEGLRVGLVHILYVPWRGIKEMVEKLFGAVPPNVIVYGDTHQAKIEEDDGLLRVNPGSPTLPNYQPRLGSVGILEIHNGQAQAHFLELK